MTNVTTATNLYLSIGLFLLPVSLLGAVMIHPAVLLVMLLYGAGLLIAFRCPRCAFPSWRHVDRLISGPRPFVESFTGARRCARCDLDLQAHRLGDRIER